MALEPEVFNDHREDMERRLQAELAYNQNLLKELSASYNKPMHPEQEAVDAETSLYHTWWDYLRSYVEVHGRDPHGVEGWDDQDVQHTLQSFGDLTQSFRQWWINGGRERFIEDGNLPIIQVIEMDQDWEPGEFPKHITLKIPLTITPAGIKAQLDRLLEICQPPQVIKHKGSGAIKKLHPLAAYHRSSYTKCLTVWRNRKLNPDWPNWRVGYEAGLCPGKDPNSPDQAHRDEARRQLDTQAAEKLQLAEQFMHFAVRGYFPRKQ
jgi:hypothetical protein